MEIKMEETIYDGTAAFYVPANIIEECGQYALKIVVPSLNRRNKPIVAVLLQRKKHEERPIQDYMISGSMVYSLKRFGLYPVFVPFDNVWEVLNNWNPSGIILPGGPAEVPTEYLDYESTRTNEQRDLKWYKANISMIEFANMNSLPLLALVGGMQILATKYGGKIKDVRHVAGDLNINQSSPVDHSKDHTIQIYKNTLLYKIVGTKSISVNSQHSGCISPKSPGDIDVMAVSPDGIIEAMAPKDRFGWRLGLQWFPIIAANAPDDNSSVKIFSNYADAVKSRSIEKFR